MILYRFKKGEMPIDTLADFCKHITKVCNDDLIAIPTTDDIMFNCSQEELVVLKQTIERKLNDMRGRCND